MSTVRITLLTTLALGLACGDDVSPRDVPREDDPTDVRVRGAGVASPRDKDGPAHRDAPRAPGSGEERPRDPVAPGKVDTNKDDVNDEPLASDGGKTPREPGAGARTR